jgi:aspartyl/glutamyl-tRNA(Asn/Gln) amidotransferase C subunit
VVTPEQVKQVAELAGLRLPAGELTELTRQLTGILGYMEALAGAPNQEAADPAPEPDPAALRPDEPGADPIAVPLHLIAPGWSDGFFTVPTLPSHRDTDPP